MNYKSDLGYSYKRPNKFRKFLIRLLITVITLVLLFLFAGTVYADEDSSSNRPDLNSVTRGSVWLLPADGIYLEAIQLNSQVNIDISGMIARAKVRQQFRNTSSRWAEGIYVFPLPENAAVDHFRLVVDGRIIEGEIQEKQQARKTYEKAKRQGQRAGLVEQQRPNIFTTALANIPPGAEMSVEIEYQQTLQYRDGHYLLRYPLVVGPRYITPSKEGAQNPMIDFGVFSESSQKSKEINKTSININLDAGIAVSNIVSTTHLIKVIPISESRHIVTLRDSSVPSDRDFILSWKPLLGKRPTAAVFNQKHDGFDYSLLQIYPPSTKLYNQRDIPRDVVFILDVSGSMAGTSIRQAKSALKLALDRLTPSDKFNIVWFNNSAQMIYYNSEPASYERIKYAKKFIDSLNAGGGTEMLSALKLALRVQPEEAFLRQVVFLTDGNVSNERDLFSYIASHLGENRLFTVGIGSAPNSFFMKKAAQAGRGSYTFIKDVQEVAAKTNILLRKLETPALTDIQIA
ncbi:MAG: marine proteobacterial sortase target protein, partial [Gammaproteobacteria bacterium]|nr:marine proteobacterial sortase target protein [Gammaproteobacteria bacterium]